MVEISDEELAQEKDRAKHYFDNAIMKRVLVRLERLETELLKTKMESNEQKACGKCDNCIDGLNCELLEQAEHALVVSQVSGVPAKCDCSQLCEAALTDANAEIERLRYQVKTFGETIVHQEHAWAEQVELMAEEADQLRTQVERLREVISETNKQAIERLTKS